MNTTLEHKSQAPNQRAQQHKSQSAKAYPSRTIVHAKLEMTNPGDHDEQEADAMARAVVSGRKIARKISGGANGSSGIAVSQQMESQLNHLQGGGQAMPEGLRSMMESGFGRDFSQVRLHTDGQAAEMSRSIGAKAFTYGKDIYFNAGRYSPESSEGRHLIAHELTHTVQQSGKVASSPESTVSSGPSVSAGTDTDAGFVSAIVSICDKLTKINTILNDLPNAARLAKGLSPIVEDFGKTIPTFIDYYRDFNMESKVMSDVDSSFDALNQITGATRTMDPKVIVKSTGGTIMKGASVVSWVTGFVGEADSALKAFNLSIAGGVYYTFRFLCAFADHPFKIPVPSPATKALLMTFNISTAIGDLLNAGLDKIGYNDWKVEMATRSAKMYGGEGTVMGDTAAFITTIPLVGEGFHYLGRFGSWIGEKLAE